MDCFLTWYFWLDRDNWYIHFIILICSSSIRMYIPGGPSGVFLFIILSDKPRHIGLTESKGVIVAKPVLCVTHSPSSSTVSTAEVGPLTVVTQSLLYGLKVNGLSTDGLVGVPA